MCYNCGTVNYCNNKKGALKMRTVKPEEYYTMNYGVTMTCIGDAYKNNRGVTGIVTEINTENRRLTVCLGESVYAELPWEEATIYSFEGKTKHGKIPDPIHALKYKKIRAKVMSLNDGKIVLSRRQNMLEAWETIVDDKNNLVYTASVIGYHKSGVFYDIGEGICAFCYVKDYSLCRIDVKTWVNLYDRAEVKIIGEPCVDQDYKICCSRKLGSPKTYYDYRVGEIVPVRISGSVRDETGKTTGFFVEVAPCVMGIADIYKNCPIVQNGDYVRAVINRIDAANRKMHLSLVERA